MLRHKLSIHTSVMLALGLFLALSAQAAGAEDYREIRMRFAGNLIQNLQQTQVDAFGQAVDTSTVAVVRAKVQGTLGRGDVSVVAKSTPLTVPIPDARCPEGFMKVIDISANNLLFTFENLSLLYGDGDGAVCINFANGDQFVAVDGRWLGGTGRFRDATGRFSVHIDHYVEVSAATQAFAEAGTITGTLGLGE